jgi:Tfp pilus assembly protein PilF
VRHPAPPPQVSASVSASAPPVVAPVSSDPIEETAPPTPTDTLVQESAEGDKNEALEALEQGKLEDAIAAGERATSLDPTDADAWRILGAAYQNQGNAVAARRCYRACTESATRGETRECTLLLQ